MNIPSAFLFTQELQPVLLFFSVRNDFKIMLFRPIASIRRPSTLQVRARPDPEVSDPKGDSDGQADESGERGEQEEQQEGK